MDTSYLLINTYLDSLKKTKSKRELLDIGISLANEIMHLLGVPKEELVYGEDALDNAFENSKFGNQKIEQWFEKHPYMGTARIALYHYKGSLPVESNFFQLNESATKAKISAITQLTSNWEDSTLTMIPNYNVGIDFFLSSDASSLKLIITNQGNLRILELSEKLSNTQIEIFENIKGCFLYDGIDSKTGNKIPYEPQRTIHKLLWNSFELKHVNKKFYMGIADHFVDLHQHIKRNPPYKSSLETIDNESKLFASRLLGRLLFLWFLKKKSIINKDMSFFNLEDLSSTDYYSSKLKVLFFDVLNTPIDNRDHNDKVTPYLNGGLFAPHYNDWIDSDVLFPENWFNTLYSHFNQFNFTTDESTPNYEQVAIDPEMLGRVFENLLASIVPETSSKASARNNKGTFYTPREIVAYMSKETLKSYLKSQVDNLKDYEGIDKLIDMSDASYLEHRSTGMFDMWGKRSDEVKIKLINALNGLKVIDPACGSGAFPIGMMQLLVKTYERLSAIYDLELNIHRVALSNETVNSYNTKLSILKNNLYGVDIEPMAIEISRLRSWLSLVVDNRGEMKPLPNLDFNFVCANSLFPLHKPVLVSLFEDSNIETEFQELIEEYFDEHDIDSKHKLKKKFEEFQNRSISSYTETALSTQLKSWHPFELYEPAVFFDSKTMFNVSKFDIVIGNPPYVGSGSRNMPKINNDIKEKYKKLYPNSAEYKINLYPLFIELAINLLKDKGVNSYIVPDSWLMGRYFSKLRKFLLQDNTFHKLIMLSDKVFDNVTVGFSTIYFVQKAFIENNEILLARPKKVFDGTDKIEFYSVRQEYFSKQDYCRIFLLLNDTEYKIVNTIQSSQKTIGKYLKGRSGLISKNGQQNIISKERKSNSFSKGIVSGGQILPYSIKYFDDWIDLTPANIKSGGFGPEWYEKPKIMIRQTGDSIIASSDYIGFYHLNNVHSFHFKPDIEFSVLEYFEAYLNSNLLNYYYNLISMEKGRAMAQIDIETIECLPVVIPDKSQVEIISGLVSKLHDKETSELEVISIKNKLNTLIYDIYSIDLMEQHYIEKVMSK